MIAVVRLDQTRHLVLGQRLGAVVELGDHFAFGEDVAVRIAGQTRVLAVLVHQRVIVLARVDAVENLLRLCLGFLVRADGLTRGGIHGRDQDVLGRDVVIRKILAQILVARHVGTIFAIIVLIERIVALADIHEVVVALIREAEVCNLLGKSVIAHRINGILPQLGHLLFLIVGQLKAQLVKLLQYHARIHRLVLGGLRHGRTERCRRIFVIPDISHTELRIHIGIIRHVVQHIARIFIRTYLVPVDRHHDRRAAVERLIVDGHARHSPDGTAHNDNQHHNQRDGALHHFAHILTLLIA